MDYYKMLRNKKTKKQDPIQDSIMVLREVQSEIFRKKLTSDQQYFCGEWVEKSLEKLAKEGKIKIRKLKNSIKIEYLTITFKELNKEIFNINFVNAWYELNERLKEVDKNE